MNEIPSERPAIRFKPGAHRRAALGHPWVYSNEIEMTPEAKALDPGAVVRIVRADGGAAGAAMFNPHTLIAGRMLSPEADVAVDAGFFAARLRRCLELRGRLFPAPFYRLVHAEADGLPGLVVDRFGEVLSVQANSAGMDRALPDLLAALDEVLSPAAVALRSDSPARTLEGLGLEARWAGAAPRGRVRVEENGIAFRIDPIEGQKTGWFYDHRDNRAFVASLAGGARVLDLYTYAGGFALPCARAGAESVLAVDRSEAGLALARASAEDNGLAERCAFQRGEAFRTLETLAGQSRHFDLVIADPPAFVKSKRELKSGLRGYRKLARLAAAVTAPGGFLFLASCSHAVDAAALLDQAARGLADVGRGARLLRQSGAAADHPVHPLLPESAYLKGLVFALD